MTCFVLNKERWSEEASVKTQLFTPTIIELNLKRKLLSDVQLSDDRTVALDVCLLEVVKKVSSVTYHLKKTATAVVILVVSLEVLVERVDSACENRDLNLRRACVTLVGSILSNDCLLFVLKHHDFFHLSEIYLSKNSAIGG